MSGTTQDRTRRVKQQADTRLMLRAYILSFLFINGVIIGFVMYDHRCSTMKHEPCEKQTKKTRTTSFSCFEFSGVNVPVFREARLVALLEVEEVKREGTGPLHLTKIRLTQFAEDECTVLTRTWADEGWVYLNELGGYSFKRVHLRGNVKLRQYGNTEKREKTNDDD